MAGDSLHGAGVGLTGGTLWLVFAGRATGAIVVGVLLWSRLSLSPGLWRRGPPDAAATASSSTAPGLPRRDESRAPAARQAGPRRRRWPRTHPRIGLVAGLSARRPAAWSCCWGMGSSRAEGALPAPATGTSEPDKGTLAQATVTSEAPRDSCQQLAVPLVVGNALALDCLIPSRSGSRTFARSWGTRVSILSRTRPHWSILVRCKLPPSVSSACATRRLVVTVA